MKRSAKKTEFPTEEILAILKRTIPTGEQPKLTPVDEANLVRFINGITSDNNRETVLAFMELPLEVQAGLPWALHQARHACERLENMLAPLVDPAAYPPLKVAAVKTRRDSKGRSTKGKGK